MPTHGWHTSALTARRTHECRIATSQQAADGRQVAPRSVPQPHRGPADWSPRPHRQGRHHLLRSTMCGTTPPPGAVGKHWADTPDTHLLHRRWAGLRGGGGGGEPAIASANEGLGSAAAGARCIVSVTCSWLVEVAGQWSDTAAQQHTVALEAEGPQAGTAGRLEGRAGRVGGRGQAGVQAELAANPAPSPGGLDRRSAMPKHQAPRSWRVMLSQVWRARPLAAACC
jgi:hypothetical protein